MTTRKHLHCNFHTHNSKLIMCVCIHTHGANISLNNTIYVIHSDIFYSLFQFLKMLVVTYQFYFLWPINGLWHNLQSTESRPSLSFSSWQNYCARNFLNIRVGTESRGVSPIKEGPPFFSGSKLFFVFPKPWEHTASGEGLPRHLYSVALLIEVEGYFCLRKPQRWRCSLREWNE